MRSGLAVAYWKRNRELANLLEGTVTEIGAEGNLVTDIPVSHLVEVPKDENTVVKFGDHETLGIFPSDHGQPESTMVASMGSSGFLEIEIVGISLGEMLGIKVGEKISVSW